MDKNYNAYVLINGVPTNILTWGKWIEESLSEVKEIIICVTGNPGLPGFYTEFASSIYKNLNFDTPVWVIGHAGHDEPSKRSFYNSPSLKGNENLFDLSGQINHKKYFIDKYVPENVKIIFIGHSIGSWVILELLKHKSVFARTIRAYLLFPTIERMAVSSNGKIFQFFCSLTPIYLYFLQLLYYLPGFIKMFIIQLYFWVFSIPKCFIKTAFKYSKPSSMEKVIFLAKDEMRTVQDLDQDHIKNIKHLLKFYYGTTDGWVPVKYYEEILENIPGLDIHLCDKKISHSFVLHESEIMGKIVTDWIIQERKRIE